LIRLADILLIQALRHWITNSAKVKEGWLFAMKDKRIGKSLSLIHSNLKGHGRLKVLAKKSASREPPSLRNLQRWLASRCSST
jgi:hypothetical protein